MVYRRGRTEGKPLFAWDDSRNPRAQAGAARLTAL
jgi:hypothetical protein